MTISVISAPPNALQVPSKSSAPHQTPRRHPLDELILASVPRSSSVGIWEILNRIASEHGVEDQRQFRMTLWPRLRELIREGVLHRVNRTHVSFEKLHPGRKPSRRIRRHGTRARRAKPASPRSDSTNPAQCGKSGQNTRLSPDAQLRRDKWPVVEPDRQTKSASPATQEAVAAAGRAMAYVRHHRKRFVGRLGNIRLYRGMPVQIPTGEFVFVYGREGDMVVWSRCPGKATGNFPDRLDFGAAPIDQIRVPRLEASALLGALKTGKRERTSESKRLAAIRNGKHPCHLGKRRGRPSRQP